MKYPKDFSLQDIRHIRRLADVEYLAVPAEVRSELSAEEAFVLRIICVIAATNSFADHGR